MDYTWHIVTDLLDWIDSASGELDAGEARAKLNKDREYSLAVRKAGGLKEFCTTRPEFIFSESDDTSPCIRRAPTSPQNAVLALLDLIDRAGGRMNGSVIHYELRKINATFPDLIDHAGGPKKFCEEHGYEELEFHSGCVQRRGEEVKNVRRLYHATSSVAAASIKQDGRFRCGMHGYAGGGIYFSSKPDAACKKSRGKTHREVVIECLVDLGSTYVAGCSEDMTKEQCEARSCSSVKVKLEDVYAVYDPDRITIVEYYETDFCGPRGSVLLRMMD